MLKLITQSATLPVSVAEAKTHLRIDSTAEDTYLQTLILTAAQLIEEETNLDIRSTTWELVGRFPSVATDAIQLPRGILSSVSSVKYFDAANDEQTIDAANYYTMSPTKTLGWIEPHTFWPITYHRPDAVTVRFVTGAAVPVLAKHAILLLVGNWFENREAVINGTVNELPLGVQRLIDQLTIPGVA